MKFRFCMARITDNDLRPLLNHDRLPSKHRAIMIFSSLEDFFKDIGARIPFTSRRMKHVKTLEIVLGMMLISSETLPHQLNPLVFAALRHLVGLQLTHIIHVSSAQSHVMRSSFDQTVS